jgi:single-stranded DNA-binding protein
MERSFECVNKNFSSGEVASDADLRWTTGGKPVVRFCVLTKHDKHIVRIPCVALDEHAEEACRLKKGDFVEVVGRLSIRPWDKQIEVVVQKLVVLAEQLPLTPDYGRQSGA